MPVPPGMGERLFAEPTTAIRPRQRDRRDAKGCGDILAVFGEPPIGLLTIVRERCSTLSHGAGLRREESR
ncbi:MAG: hypothetical protein J2P48_19800, partial [Alphaproteobacteria bacterium]|nr:hypothetical protein [Alphaproteobacteria bacterium]